MTLMVNQFTGFGDDIHQGIPFAQFLHEELNTTDQTTYSFTNVPLGNDGVSRLIVASVHNLDTATNQISSATIAGVSATIPVQLATPAGTGAGVGLIQAVLPPGSGTTGTIAVTCSDASFRLQIGVWALYRLNSTTAAYTNSHIGTSQTWTTTPAQDAVAIAAVAAQDATDTTWTNLAESFDKTGEGTNERYSGAMQANLPSISTGFAFSSTAASNARAVIAIWR